MKKFIILVILNLRLFSSCSINSVDGKDSSLKLISNILQSVDFQHCSLFIYSTKENKIWPISNESPITNNLYTGTLKIPVYISVDSTVNYSDDDDDATSLLFSSPLADSMLNTMKLQSKVSRVKKFSNNCLFHIVDLENEENLELYPSFLKRISSLHPSPLIQRTTDFFLFLLSEKSFDVLASPTSATTKTIETTRIQSKTDHTKDSLLHPKYRDYLTMRLYNKIFLIIPNKSSTTFENTTTTTTTKTNTRIIQIKYACIYCSNSGPPDDSGLNSNIPFVNLHISKKDDIFQNGNPILTKSFLYPYYTRNLNGFKIRCSVPSAVIARVLLKFNSDTGEHETVRGLQLVLLNVLKAQMNFTMKVFPSVGGGGTGLKANNGTWFGVVGDVYHERADIGTGVGISESRFEVIDFIAYYEYISLIFVIGKQDQIFTWLAIFWPFSQIVWGIVVFCIIITFIFCTLLRHLGNKISNNEKEQDNDNNNIEIVETTIIITTATTTTTNNISKKSTKKKLLKITSTTVNPKARLYLQKHLSKDMKFLSTEQLSLYILQSLLGQTTKLPKTSSLRFFTSFWLLFLIVITTAYTSKLFGFLAFPFLESVPNTFEELADAENYGIGLRYIGGAGYNSFKTSKTPAIQKIFKRMELLKDPLICFEKAITNKYACIAYELQFEYSKKRNFSDIHGRTTLSISQGRIFPVNVGLGVQKGTVFASQVNKIITFAFETGLVETWSSKDMQDIHIQKRIWEKANNITPFILDHEDQIPRPLTVPHFTGAYFLFFCGLGMSLAIFIFEEFCYNYRRYGTIKAHKRLCKNGFNCFN